jgi:hypothetical protein
VQAHSQASNLPDTGEHVLLQLSDLSDQKLLRDIKAVLNANGGPSEIYILVGDDDPKKIRLPFKIAVTSELIASLGDLVGPDQVIHLGPTS